MYILQAKLSSNHNTTLSSSSFYTHLHPHKTTRYTKVTICNHQADSQLYVWQDVWSGDFASLDKVWTSNVLIKTRCHQTAQTNCKPTHTSFVYTLFSHSHYSHIITFVITTLSSSGKNILVYSWIWYTKRVCLSISPANMGRMVIWYFWYSWSSPRICISGYAWYPSSNLVNCNITARERYSLAPSQQVRDIE